MKKLIISADIGKYQTKLVGRFVDESKSDLKRVCLRTKMYDLAEGYMDVEGEASSKIVFNGKTYIVGEQGSEKSYGTSKTKLLHKLTCYAGITKFLEPNTKTNDIYMVLSCPLSVLLVEAAKEEYKSFIKGDGPISITVDGRNYNFEIKDIMIKSEGSGIMYLEPNLFINQTVLVVDLGGVNMGGSLYRNKTCNREDRFIEEHGSEQLLKEIRNQISIYKNGDLISDAQAEKVLWDGFLKKAGKVDINSLEYVEKAKMDYYKDMLKYFKEHRIDINSLDSVVFLGGTTQHIKDIIAKDLPHSHIPANSQWSSVEGLYKIAFAKYSK